MGQKLVERLNSSARRQMGNWHTVTAEDVAAVVKEIPQAGRPYFANLWAETTPLERSALEHIIRTCNGCTLEELAVACDVVANQLLPALTSLREARVVTECESHWRIEVELTRLALVDLSRRGALPAY